MYVSLSTLKNCLCVCKRYISGVTLQLLLDNLLFLHSHMFLRFIHAHECRRMSQLINHTSNEESYRLSQGIIQSQGREGHLGRFETQ